MVNPDMKAELNVSVKGGNFELNNKYLADMNVREAANIVFSMKQSDTVSEDVIRNEIRQKIWEQYGTEFPLPIEKVSYTEAVKGSDGSGGSGGGGGSRSAGNVSSTEQHRPSVVDEQAQWVQNGTDWKLTLSSGEIAADRWVQKDDHWYWFKADGIMVHSEWLSYMGHWYYVIYSHHLANA